MKLLKSVILFSFLSFSLSVANAQSVLVSKIAGKAVVGEKADSPWEHLVGTYSDTANQASCSLETGQNSDNIILSNFNFSIPEGATIKGVKITLEKKGGTMGFTDKTVRLVVNGLPTGNNYASDEYWRTSTTRTNYGSETNLWGLSLTAADINSPDFGVMLQVANSDMGSTSTAQLGFIRISITYTTSSGESLITSSTLKSDGVN